MDGKALLELATGQNQKDGTKALHTAASRTLPSLMLQHITKMHFTKDGRHVIQCSKRTGRKEPRPWTRRKYEGRSSLLTADTLRVRESVPLKSHCLLAKKNIRVVMSSGQSSRPTSPKLFRRELAAGSRTQGSSLCNVIVRTSHDPRSTRSGVPELYRANVETSTKSRRVCS